MRDERDRTAAPDRPGGPPTLPVLLNILWRRRLLIVGVTVLGLVAGVVYGLVVTPLYRATAVVRPGIVSFGPEGAPVREWQHKDILNWFDRRLYWQALRQRPAFADLDGPPHIISEHLPAGGLYQRSGNVIVLETLSPDPDRAMRTLDLAVAAFNDQADTSSRGGTLELTRIGLRRTIAELQVDRDLIETNREKLAAEIAAMQQEVRRLEGLGTQAGLLAAREEHAATLRDRALAASDSSLAAQRAQLQEMAGQLARLEGPGAGAAVGEFARALASLRIHGFDIRTHADTTAVAAAQARYAARIQEVERDQVLAAEREAVEDEIRALRVERDRELPLRQRRLEEQIASERERLDMLTPLQRVGEITVSDRPVRPRKLRATVILTVLALGLSLFLALVVDYLLRWRRVVFGADPR